METPSPKRQFRPNGNKIFSPDISFPEQAKILHKAIDSHDEVTVRTILDTYNLDPNKLIPGLSMTFLHLAVGLSKDSTIIVEEFLNRGGNPNNVLKEEGVSPMHLSVIYDYERVLQILMRFGGDPKIPSGDGKTCYDLAKENVEEEMLEKCFLYFYRRSLSFRKSIKPTDSLVLQWKSNHTSSLSSLSDNFFTCGSDIETTSTSSSVNSSMESDVSVVSARVTRPVNYSDFMTEDESCVPIKIIPTHPPINYSDLMTEDESEAGCSSSDDGRLSTIPEESANNSTPLQKAVIYSNTTPLSERNESSGNQTDPSYVNSTPSPQPEPTKQELVTLQTNMKANNIPIPVTKSTFRVLNRFAQDEVKKLSEVTSPKPGTQNFSSELKLSLTNLNCIDEWGNLKIDLLQSLSNGNNGKTSKSFYNYLLLDPKVTKRVNFSGNHLKSDVIKNSDKFETFLKSIFYIGKGCGKRPIQHLVDAKAIFSTPRRSNTSKTSNINNVGEKLGKILEIWKSGLGVIVVSVFHYSSEREANVNEASMIDAVGLVELSNIKKGSYGGTIATTWSQKAKNQLGCFLLYKSFCSFAVGDQRSFFPKDI